MSFCFDVKNEILSKNIKYDNFLSFFAGLIESSAEFYIEDGVLGINIKTENKKLLKQINWYLKKTYGDDNLAYIFNSETSFNNVRYNIRLPIELCSDILRKIKFYDDEDNFSFEIDESFLETKELKIAFIKGVFIGAGTSNISLDPQKRSGSQIQFMFTREQFANDFAEILASEDFSPKKIERANNFVVYINSSNDEVFKFFVNMDAMSSAFEYKDKEVQKQIKNDTNRTTNCISGNIKRMIDASIKQKEAIRVIEDTIGIESLPPSLMEACLLRKNNPETSVADLVNMYDGEISKSGLNHRFNKIIEIAKNLKN